MQAQATELDPESFASGLKGPPDEQSLDGFAAGLRQQPQGRTQELDPEAFAAGLQEGAGGLAQPRTAPEPGAANPLSVMAGTFLEGMGSLAGAGRIASEKLGGAFEGHLGMKPEAPFFSGMESGLKGLAEETYPQASRGQGNLLTEGIPAALGSVAAAAPGAALGGPAAVLTFGAQNGVPLYYDVLKSTGSKEKATSALLFGAAVGQLEFLGAEKYAGSILKKLAGGALGKAVKDVAVHAAMGSVGEAATEAGQQTLSDLAYEHLTGEDLANWNRIKKALGPAAIVGGAFGAVDAALSRTPTAQKTSEALAVAHQPSQVEEGARQETSSAEAPSASQATNATPAVQVSSVVPAVDEVAAADATPEEAATVPVEAPQPAADKSVPESEAVAPEKTTSIKNAVVERELKEMGLPLPKGEERTSFVELHGKALETFQADQASGARLVDELAAEPRAPSGEEDALLSLELNRRINERDAVEEAYLKDPSEANKARIERAKTDYAKAADVTKAVGTKSSISLAARKMMVNRDYSLAAMERAVQVAKGGKELTDQESTRVKDLHRKIAETQKKYESYVSTSEAKQAELEAENAVLKEKKSLLSKTRRKDRQLKILESKKKIDEIVNKLASGQQAAAGLDPAKIGLTVQLAAEHIRLGYQSFSLWAEEMVGRIGEHIRPYLRPAWDQAKGEEEQAMLKSYKSRKETDIAKLKERTKNKQFELKRRVTPIEKDKEAIRLKAEYEGAKRQFESEKAKHERKNRTRTQKALSVLFEPVHFTKAFITAYDVSAVFRQGGFFTLGHPIKAAKHAKRMFSAMFSAKKALEIDTEIRSRTLHLFGEASGLQLTQLDDGLGPQEEAIRSHLSDYLPGIKASNRAYITFLNLQRSAIFDSIVQGLPEKATMDQGRAIANLVNVGSGRGNPGKFAGAMEGAALAFWSPRLLLSRFQLLAGQPAWKKGARKAVAKEYARFLVGLAGIYALAKLFDADIEEDPRSSDFGKIKIKNTRIDPLAGLAQVFVLMSRLISGETKSSLSGKVRPIRGDKREFKDRTAAEIIGTFLRTKSSPVVGTGLDVLSGENVIGEKVTGKSVAKNLLVPMTIRDTEKAIEDLGVPAGSAAGIAAAFGMSVQTYDGKKKSK